MSEELKFPDGFLWGTTTSAHQVEGNNHNDWTEWENSQKRVDELKKDGKNLEDFISGRACDHYNLYEQDFDIVKSLGQNAHRFSIEWSRIEPEEGRFDQEAMEHYINVVKSLRIRGIEPFVTLWHFTLPIWFAKKGGFLNKESPEIFTRYVKYVVDKLQDKVGKWITFNEPVNMYGYLGYLHGYWPPKHHNILEFFRLRKNVITAHILAYQAIKKIYSTNNGQQADGLALTSHNIIPQVGVVETTTYLIMSPILRAMGMGRIFDKVRNFYLWDHIIKYQDFIGLNYYTTRRFLGSTFESPRGFQQELMGWEIYPQGIYKILISAKKYHKPIYITENGIADAKDIMRAKFIKDHLYWVNRAIHDGVDVQGYFYWSLLDNFEWAHGFGPRFGLVEIDYKTMERKIRPSAYEYKKICESNSLILDSSY